MRAKCLQNEFQIKLNLSLKMARGQLDDHKQDGFLINLNFETFSNKKQILLVEQEMCRLKVNVANLNKGKKERKRYFNDNHDRKIGVQLPSSQHC